MTFAEKLIAYRKTRGWKDIIPIHEYTGISKENLWAWEAGRRIPPVYVQDLLFFKLDRVGLPSNNDDKVKQEVNNKTCIACSNYDEDINYSKNCSPCSLPEDADDFHCNFNQDTSENITAKLIRASS